MASYVLFGVFSSALKTSPTDLASPPPTNKHYIIDLTYPPPLTLTYRCTNILTSQNIKNVVRTIFISLSLSNCGGHLSFEWPMPHRRRGFKTDITTDDATDTQVLPRKYQLYLQNLKLLLTVPTGDS